MIIENSPSKTNGKDSEIALRMRLEAFKPNFLAIRTSMGFETEIGLVSLPKCHGAYTAAMIPELKKQKNGQLLYYIPSFFSAELTPLTKQDLSGVLIMPNHSTKTLRIVSVYQQDFFSDPENKLLTAGTNVYEGLVAHALAHVVRDGDYPKHQIIIDFLAQKKTNIDDEAQIDIIASLLGFKPQILAKLQYMIMCLSGYPGADNTSYSLFRLPGRIIEELKRRIEEVKKYS